MKSRYFFDLFDGDGVLEDETGLLFSNTLEALAMAREVAFSQVESADRRFDLIDPRELRIRGSAGKWVAKVAFRYVSI